VYLRSLFCPIERLQCPSDEPIHKLLPDSNMQSRDVSEMDGFRYSGAGMNGIRNSGQEWAAAAAGVAVCLFSPAVCS
jgi:hypothetical protein